MIIKGPDRKDWNKKLLVEGVDDLHVIAQLRNKYGLDENFHIVNCEGASRIRPNLIAHLKISEITTIGIIIDADAVTEHDEDGLKARWDSLRNLLIEKGYTVPETPSADGTIIPSTNRNPKIGIWLMPDNAQKRGMIEHFVATLIPSEDSLKLKADQILNELEASEINRYPLIHRSKAFIRTWLAWQEEPGINMGVAIAKSYLDHNTELCQRFVAWLNTLFNT